jgi:gamma-glutamylcyclotransferase (GGCT)/AIG2-like uncharacterized protein YtfP
MPRRIPWSDRLSSLPALKDHLFAYGTLMHPAVFHRVTGLQRVAQAAMVQGYRRGAVKGATYPAMIESAQGEVEGVVFRDLPAACWTRLDRYEGGLYRRHGCRALLEDGGSLRAQVYLLHPAYLLRLDGRDWDSVRFLDSGWRAYLEALQDRG